MTALLDLHLSACDRLAQIEHDRAYVSPSPILTNGALARSLVSNGVVNRSVVRNKKQHSSLALYADQHGVEVVRCVEDARSPSK